MKNIKQTLVSAASKVNSKALGLMAVCSAAAMPVVGVFATAPAPDLFDSAQKLIKTIYEGIFGLTTILAIVCVIIACLMMMFSSNPRTVESAKGWLKRIIIAWVIINALGLIISSLTTWLSNAGASNAGTYF